MRHYKSKFLKDDPEAPLYELEYQNFNTEKVILYNRKGDYSININLAVLYEDFIEVDNTSGCEHVWKEYVGLRESFTFCTKCDIKK
jgi:hypothetical protein